MVRPSIKTYGLSSRRWVGCTFRESQTSALGATKTGPVVASLREGSSRARSSGKPKRTVSAYGTGATGLATTASALNIVGLKGAPTTDGTQAGSSTRSTLWTSLSDG